MTLDLHPELDDLILYCMSTPGSAPRDPGDAAAVERVRHHLKECGECRARTALLRSDMALVTMSVPQIAPPPGAKQRLFQMAGIPLPAVAEKPKLMVTSMPAEPDAGKAPSPLPRHRSPALLWGGWLAAAACLLYAVQVREVNQGMRQQLQASLTEMMVSDASAARAREVLEVLTSPQAQRVTLVSAHAKPEPTGHAVYLKDRGALVFTASNLAPLPPNKTYELWVIPASGAAPVPAGTFLPDVHGMASVLLPKLPKGIQAKAFGVTMENAGGSKSPTLPILLAGG